MPYIPHLYNKESFFCCYIKYIHKKQLTVPPYTNFLPFALYVTVRQANNGVQTTVVNTATMRIINGTCVTHRRFYVNGLIGTNYFPTLKWKITRYRYTIISPAYENPRGLFYRLDNYFSVGFFLHRTLYPGKIYPVKNNFKMYF